MKLINHKLFDMLERHIALSSRYMRTICHSKLDNLYICDLSMLSDGDIEMRLVIYEITSATFDFCVVTGHVIS